MMRIFKACFDQSKRVFFHVTANRLKGVFNMNNFRLRTLIFLALCCDLGLFSKRLISPAANLITGFLHIPGGIGTSLSLMFLVIAAVMVERFGCATIMGAVQSVLALAFGMVGSMGALAPIGYIVPGLVIDLLLTATRKSPLSQRNRVVLANAAAAPCAALTANIIVFHLSGVVLLLYLCVSTTSGAIFGLAGGELARRLTPVFGKELQKTGAKVRRSEL